MAPDDRAHLDLSGAWRANEAGGELAKEFSDPAFDDSEWPNVQVPHHWRNTDRFVDSDGPILYRKRFSTDTPEQGRRTFLELDGIFYFGDVWFDGAYAGNTEGYFVPHAFEVTDALARDREHTIAIEVASPPQRDRTAKRTITGVFGHWDNLDPRWNPGGIWRPLRLTTTGSVRIARLRALCVEASVERGRLAIDVTLEAGIVPPRASRIVTTVTGPDGTLLALDMRDATLAGAENHLAWVMTVDAPPLWWPRRLGDQPQCTLTFTVEADGEPSDARTLRTAFRDVRFDDWTFVLNGERMFLMGSNQGPARMALGETTAAEMRRDVQLALDANLDFLRVHAHVSLPSFYEAADELGLLVWQDFPLQWGYARGVRKQAVRQARVMVDQLAHHPSIVVWCAHNEPLALDFAPGAPIRLGAAAKLAASMFLPTWNKDILDRSVSRAIAKADPSRHVNRHSGVLPGPFSRGTDTHAYFGWYHGEMTGLAPALRAVPRLARFVTEFGAQAVPSTAAWMEPQRWPDLDWDTLFSRHALQRALFERHVPPGDCKSFDEWREATQAYQAALIQLQVEDLRRVKYVPTGGFAHFCFADGHPAVTWSVLDHERVAKRGYEALRDACRPVLPMLEPRTGIVHVVSELREALAGAVVEVVVDGRSRRFTGDVPADGVAYVGRVDLTGAVDVELAIEHRSIDRVVSRYPLLLLKHQVLKRSRRRRADP